MTKRRQEDPLPTAQKFTAAVTETAHVLFSLPRLYEETLDAGSWPSSGEGVHVTWSGPSDATYAAFNGRSQRIARADAKRAVKWLRRAQRAIENAQASLKGEWVDQPEKVDGKATMTQAEFDRIRERRQT